MSVAGGDIAEVMLDFIEWLTQQDFGRHCILSVRDILSWVSFLNTVCERDEDGFMTMGVLEDEEEAEWDLRLDTVTAFIHAACLVYIDALGSGQLTATLMLLSGCKRKLLQMFLSFQDLQCPVQTGLLEHDGCAWHFSSSGSVR